MTAAAQVVWEGAEPLRAALVPVDSIRVHPRNPRRGNVKEIAKSLGRWGQTRAVLVDDEGTIIAGNHTYLAAVASGWTHVAAVANHFETEEEARDYLLADNRLGDQGEYDRAELVLFLEDLDRTGAWDGTGYVPDDLGHLRGLDALAAAPPAAPPSDMVLPPSLRERVLMFDDETYEAFNVGVRALRRHYGLEGITETVLRAVHLEARRLNQDAG